MYGLFVPQVRLGMRDTENALASRLQWQCVAMRQFQVNSSSEDIVHPRCAKCGAPMWLTRLEPDGPGWEKHTFECQACQNEAIDIVRSR